jgi:hypothetical protein
MLVHFGRSLIYIRKSIGQRMDPCGTTPSMPESKNHWSNMDEVRSTKKFGWAPVYSSTHWLRPRNSPPPPHWAHIPGRLLVSQDRGHLFVTPGKKGRRGPLYK